MVTALVTIAPSQLCTLLLSTTTRSKPWNQTRFWCCVGFIVQSERHYAVFKSLTKESLAMCHTIDSEQSKLRKAVWSEENHPQLLRVHFLAKITKTWVMLVFNSSTHLWKEKDLLQKIQELDKAAGRSVLLAHNRWWSHTISRLFNTNYRHTRKWKNTFQHWSKINWRI